MSPKGRRSVLIAAALAAGLARSPARAGDGARVTGSAELSAGGGYDSNLFLQIAASPDSPNYHPYSGGFVRASPLLGGGIGGPSLRLDLRYGADLIATFGSGQLYLEDAQLALSAPDLGPLALVIGASGGRFDASAFPSDRYWSWGALAQATLAAAERVKIGALYQIDWRRFGDPGAVSLVQDLTQLAELRVAYTAGPKLTLALEAGHLALRSTPFDAAQPSAELSRWRGAIDAAYTARSDVTLSGTLWAGVQSPLGGEQDRQAGGWAAISLRAGTHVDFIARYELMVSRAPAADAGYSRQVATLGLSAHAGAGRRVGAAAGDGTAPSAPLVQGTLVRFRARAPGASSVVIIGSWNEWAATGAAQELQRTREPGLWERWVRLPEGRHRYHLLIDGRATRPPDAPAYRPDDFGGEDGVLEVGPQSETP